MEFSRQEYWSRFPFPTSKDLPNPGIKFMSLVSPALAGRFFITAQPRNLAFAWFSLNTASAEKQWLPNLRYWDWDKEGVHTGAAVVVWCKVSELKWAAEGVHSAPGMRLQNWGRQRRYVQGGCNGAARCRLQMASLCPGMGCQSPGVLERTSM